MAVQNEGQYTSDFLLWTDGELHRYNYDAVVLVGTGAVVDVGVLVEPGTVMAQVVGGADDGKWTPMLSTSVDAPANSEDIAAGILVRRVRMPADGTDLDVSKVSSDSDQAIILTGDALVKSAGLRYTANVITAEQTAAVAALAALGIKVRTSN